MPRIPRLKGPWAGQAPRSLLEGSVYFGAHALNGVGERTRLWVSLLEELTCVQRLDLLTTLPWAGAISCVHLLRTSRAWCPSCYGEEGSSAEHAYERLLWVFQAVTVCPNHRQLLESICPFCKREQYVIAPKSRPGYCSRCYRWLGRKPEARGLDSELSEQITTAEMVGALLAAASLLPTPFGLDLFRQNLRGFVHAAGGYRRFRLETQGSHIRDWFRHAAATPRMTSLLKLSRSVNVSLVRLLTEQVDNGNRPDQKQFWKAHYRFAGSVVEAALQAALWATIAPSLEEIAHRLGYQTAISLKCRFPVLCREIGVRRRAGVITARPSRKQVSVPKERIEQALTAELHKAGFTNLEDVAASVGVRSKRRLYRGFHDLRSAIVAKNAAIRARRSQALGVTLKSAIEAALTTALNEYPAPTVEDVARRLGFATVKPLTSRFPELTMELRTCRRRSLRVKVKRGHQVDDRARQRLIEALEEFPPPSCAAVVRSLAGHRTKIREGFPGLWRAVHARYVKYKQQTGRLKRQAIAKEAFLIVAELHQRGVYPTIRLVGESMPSTHFRCRQLIADAVRLARRELSIGPYETHHDDSRYFSASGVGDNSTLGGVALS